MEDEYELEFIPIAITYDEELDLWSYEVEDEVGVAENKSELIEKIWLYIRSQQENLDNQCTTKLSAINQTLSDLSRHHIGGIREHAMVTQIVTGGVAIIILQA